MKRGAPGGRFDAPGKKAKTSSFTSDIIPTDTTVFDNFFNAGVPQAGSGKIESLETRDVKIRPELVEYVMTAEHREILIEEAGADVECIPERGLVKLTGTDVQLKQAQRILSRVEMHCHWGVGMDKVKRLLKRPPPIESVLIRLSPMDEHLKAAQKTLTGTAVTHLNIGKDKQCDCIIDHKVASRLHCQITLDSEKGGVYIADSSTNGTWLNGQKLPTKKLGKVLLSHGDEILFRDPASGNAEFGYMVNLTVISQSKEVKLEAPREVRTHEWASSRRLNPCGIL
mmetsp:Transcript_128653/g.223031  ORF Transcript_128653/g.223031 Transcript_128653/m.223031 type:complete len:284 (-) Transcript_128653:74-925(-)